MNMEYAVRVLEDCKSIKTAFNESAKKIYKLIYPNKPYTWFHDVSISKDGDDYTIHAFYDAIDSMGHDRYLTFSFPSRWLEMKSEDIKEEYDANNDLAQDNGEKACRFV